MVILPAGEVRGEAGSTPPASRAPESRLWGAATRIDKDELQVQPVCFFCNLHKGPNLTGIDPQTGQIVPLFHPRQDVWYEHFEERGLLIVGLTPTGRVTVRVLAMNTLDRLDLRAEIRES